MKEKGNQIAHYVSVKPLVPNLPLLVWAINKSYYTFKGTVGPRL